MTAGPDVVFLRLNAKQLMVLSDAIPGLRIEGKPQCHIVAVSKEHGRVAASVGCALSRVRTGMPPTEMTCAIPAGKLPEILASIQQHSGAEVTFQLVEGASHQVLWDQPERSDSLLRTFARSQNLPVRES